MTSSWFLRQGSLHAILHDGFWKSDHDCLIAFHSNLLSAMNGFRDNEVLLQAGHDVIVISPPEAASRYFTWQITCKRGSAAVVTTSCCSYGTGRILHLSRAETTEPINTKFWTIDYLGEMKEIAKFGSDWFYGGFPRWVKCTLLLFFLLVSSFRLQTTIRNGFWCTMAQKIRFGARMCLLSNRSVKI